jgi:hypothetical protein
MKWMTSNVSASASGFPREFISFVFIKTSAAELLKPVQHFILSFQNVWHLLYSSQKHADCTTSEQEFK